MERSYCKDNCAVYYNILSLQELQLSLCPQLALGSSIRVRVKVRGNSSMANANTCFGPELDESGFGRPCRDEKAVGQERQPRTQHVKYETFQSQLYSWNRNVSRQVILNVAVPGHDQTWVFLARRQESCYLETSQKPCTGQVEWKHDMNNVVVLPFGPKVPQAVGPD